ncbi:hypothetical protein HID58_038626 [Brassica napus]|uniref:Uncharacterized protein n=1 Tax=Brassica napus TaxID=3708 RepID=A0ABQ8BPR8_BRANA|nr:hypothetical protein HID58_038626 [Brassica napus]
MAKFLTSLFLICLTFVFTRDVSADDDNREASSSFCFFFMIKLKHTV